MNTSWPLVLVCAGCLLGAPKALAAEPGAEAAQDEPTAQPAASAPESPGGPPQEARIRLALYQRVKLPADLDQGNARVAVHRSGASGELSKWFGYVRLTFRLSGERSVYDLSESEALNSPPDPLTPGDPWGTLSFFRLSLGALIPFGRSDWSLFLLGGLRLGWENGTEVRDGFSGSLIAAVGYRVDETLILQFGVGLISRIEGSPFGFPLIGVRWRPTDWFRLETRGPGVELGFKPTSILELTLGARYANRQYRFEDRRTVLAEHILEDQEALVEFGATLSPWPFFSLRGVLGLVAYQEFEVRDPDGDTRYRSRTDPAPYLELELALRF